MVKNLCVNEVSLSGKVTEMPKYHHTSNDCEYFEFFVSSKRISEAEDVLPVIIAKDKLEDLNIQPGDFVRIKGDYRSYNNHSSHKLILYVFAKEIEICEEKNENTIQFEGFICKKGNLRETPLNKKRILDLMIAVNRPSNKSSYIPCIAWGLDENKVAELEVGDKIRVSGRIQSREYQKVLENNESETRVAYEVSIKKFSKCE